MPTKLYVLRAAREAGSGTDFATGVSGSCFLAAGKQTQRVGIIQVQLSVATAASVSLVKYYDSTTSGASVVGTLTPGGSTQLVGGVVYSFHHLVDTAFGWNYRFATAVNVNELLVSELIHGEVV